MAREFKKIVREELSYVPEMFIGEKKPLTFKMRTLSQKELAKFADAGTRLNVNSGMLILGTTEIEYEIARLCINGWDNFVVEGDTIAFKRDGAGKLDERIIEVASLDLIEVPGQFLVAVRGDEVVGVSIGKVDAPGVLDDVVPGGVYSYPFW
jgi:hypothetical protein